MALGLLQLFCVAMQGPQTDTNSYLRWALNGSPSPK